MSYATPLLEEELASESLPYTKYLWCFCYGLLLPLGFAPFHLPGLAILGLALFYKELSSERRAPFLEGLSFGLGLFIFGVSWIYVSIHDYGHLSGLLSAGISLLFCLYLSLFFAIAAYGFSRLLIKPFSVFSGLLFAAVWVLCEYLRARLFGGFPWLLLGFAEFDTPMKHLLPVLGTFGAGFVGGFAATFLSRATQTQGLKRSKNLLIFVILIVSPIVLKPVIWAEKKGDPISVGLIQANLSMRDKWDEDLFWELLHRYQKSLSKLMGKQLIVLPESAIPLPPTYLPDFLQALHVRAKKADSAILLGMPYPSTDKSERYYNALVSYGRAKGVYFKQHLVPFSEHIPSLFRWLSAKLDLPIANLKSGDNNQNLIKVHRHPVASLICYELAYGDLLRKQLPGAEWIVSISDDGWFGHSLAMYQQLQMAQVRSLEAARFQVVSNNDGLSSVIDNQGGILDSLPAWQAGVLETSLYASSGSTPWVRFGDGPMLLLALAVVLFALVRKLLNYRLLTRAARIRTE